MFCLIALNCVVFSLFQSSLLHHSCFSLIIISNVRSQLSTFQFFNYVSSFLPGHEHGHEHGQQIIKMETETEMDNKNGNEQEKGNGTKM